MNATINLLDKYKKACSIASDNACAVSLGVSRQAVSKWRHAENHPEADTVEKMCEAIGEPTARWLPLIEAERARTPSAKKAWLRLAQIAAAVALTVGVFGPSSAHAQAPGDFRVIGAPCILCQILDSAIRRAGTTLAAAFRALFRTEAPHAI